MSNEEFQTIVLKKLDTIDNGLIDLKKDLNEIKVKMDAVIEQTAVLTEFKTETEQQFGEIKDTLHFVLHKEIVTEKELYLLKMKQA